MSQPILYGLTNCDTCKKARKWLEREGVAHQFIDYKLCAIPGDALKAWAKQVGWDRLINRSGTTWRGLPPNRKDPQTDAEYVLLVREYPSLVRRPVALIDGEIMVGFTGGLYEKRFQSTGIPQSESAAPSVRPELAAPSVRPEFVEGCREAVANSVHGSTGSPRTVSAAPSVRPELALPSVRPELVEGCREAVANSVPGSTGSPRTVSAAPSVRPELALPSVRPELVEGCREAVANSVHGSTGSPRTVSALPRRPKR